MDLILDDELNALFAQIKKSKTDLIIGQAALNYFGSKLKEDGIFGQKTARAVNSIKKDEKFFEYLAEVLPTGKYNLDYNLKVAGQFASKEVIMNYLAEAEGTEIHFNAGERDITSAYGIYRSVFPRAKIFSFYKNIATSRHDIMNREVFTEINNIIARSRQLQKQERELAYKFYVENFMDERLMPFLDEKPAMSFFSISVNGGRGRGIKALQSALGVTVDGQIGKGTLSALKATTLTAEELNMSLLMYMQGFYDYLIRKNPRKFARFRRGWVNRLRALA